MLESEIQSMHIALTESIPFSLQIFMPSSCLNVISTDWNSTKQRIVFGATTSFLYFFAVLYYWYYLCFQMLKLNLVMYWDILLVLLYKNKNEYALLYIQCNVT